jgi:hypothetical protein
VFSEGPYRFFFYSNEGNHPPHVHVERGDAIAMFWLNPVRVGRNRGFSTVELWRIELIVRRNVDLCLERWNAFFGA